MADSPAPAVLRSLESATEKHRLERKLLLCRTIGEGRELLRAMAARGSSWLGWEVSTPRRLALELAGPWLQAAGRSLADDYDQEAGVDTALDEAIAHRPGTTLEGLAETAGFRQAVAGAIRELTLAEVRPDRLRGVPASNPAVRDLLCDVLERYGRWLEASGLVSVAEVLARAGERVEREGSDALGAGAVWLVPGLPTAGAAGGLVRALRQAGAGVLRADPVAVPVPDGLLWEPADQATPLGDLLGDRPVAVGDLDLFTASGPAEEIREVLRRCVQAGIPWDQVEIVATDPVVYGGALHALAQRLGVPVSFAVGLPVERTRMGRAVAGYFRWIESGYPSAEIRRLLESGDLRPDGWDGSTTALARRLRLLRIGWGHDRYLPAIERALAATAEVRPRRRESPEDAERRAERERSELIALRTLMTPLLAATPLLDPDDSGARIAPGELADGLRRFIRLVPAGDAPSATARDRYTAIADRVGARLARPMAPAAALAALRRHLRIRVPAPDREGAAPWVSSGGYLHLSDVEHGGLTGRPVTFVVGLDAERYPGAGLQDPLLLDAQRRALDPVALPTSADRLAATRFALAASLSRLRGRVTLSCSVWDPAEAREIAPAGVMLQAYRVVAQDPTASFEDMAGALGEPASAVPRTGALDTADLWFDALSRDGILRDGTAAVRDAFPALAAGADGRAALRSGTATPMHGLVAARPGLDPRRNPDLILSASGLEDLGTCGLRYFYKYALRVRPPDDPELDPDSWLDPLRRGSLLHSVFERTLREGRERGMQPDEEAFEEHALAVLDAEAAAFRVEVPPPGRAVMERELLRLREDVRSFVGMVREGPGDWEALELTFGLGDRPPAEVPVTGGTLRLRGAIDRVDRRPDGSLVVIDYKTGSSGRYEKNGLFHGGRRLQNTVYTVVAEALLEGRVEGMEYQFPTRTGRNERVRFTRSEARQGIGLLARLLDLAAAGRFLPTENGDDCTFCDFAAVCRHRAEGFDSHTPLADWAKDRLGTLEEYQERRHVREWEQMMLGELEADG